MGKANSARTIFGFLYFEIHLRKISANFGTLVLRSTSASMLKPLVMNKRLCDVKLGVCHMLRSPVTCYVLAFIKRVLPKSHINIVAALNTFF